MLEAWRRLVPAQHFTPLPSLVFCLMIERMMAEGLFEYALMSWLAYHAVLRPSDPLLAFVGDLVLPATLDDILAGERGGFQIRQSKGCCSLSVYSNLLNIFFHNEHQVMPIQHSLAFHEKYRKLQKIILPRI